MSLNPTAGGSTKCLFATTDSLCGLPTGGELRGMEGKRHSKEGRGHAREREGGRQVGRSSVSPLHGCLFSALALVQ